jgi:YidC/Oxa1 family membrane protein insertase
MDRRFTLFLVSTVLLTIAYMALMQKLGPQANKPPVAQNQQADAAKPADQEKDKKEAEKEKPAAVENKPAEKADENAEKKPDEKTVELPPEPAVPQQWLTLGSVDPKAPFRMMVTLTNRGAALTRVELSDQKYRDVDLRSGYLGHIVMDPQAQGDGCPVQLVGPGTPADKAGLQVGDVLQSVGGKQVTSAASLDIALEKTKPGQTVELSIVRAGKPLTLSAELTRYPMEVIKPEAEAPPSLLMTMEQIDKEAIPDDAKICEEAEKSANKRDLSDREKKDYINREVIGRELPGVDLRDGVWKTVEADRQHAVFSKTLPKFGLEILKTYALEKVPEEAQTDPDYKAYHLTMKIEVVNKSGENRKVAYRLDGPNGLPTEGQWYANKVSRNWSGAGLRDVVVSIDRRDPIMDNCSAIAEGKTESWQAEPLTFVAVDAQYFSAVLIPQPDKPEDIWFGPSRAIRLGKVNEQHPMWANTSFRLVGLPHQLEPGKSLAQEYVLFAGPKKPDILDQYDLGSLVYYGWFWWVAKPMLWILHHFYALVCNYGIAIIMLTVLVRGLMFPLSFKQTLNAHKMAIIQPEAKAITAKYKNDVEGRTKAMQELYRKHNTNPFSGCLVIFIQLPVFVGLYKSLMVDVELRDAPLISSAVRWCSNLAAPDMVFDWHHFMPTFIQSWLGPYFNILPVLTILLFLWQQHKMMPPPTDEQQAMQQKMMKYMMIFMGVMFFKVASGLCIYFIASSLWGLGERKFLPKRDAQPASGDNVGPKYSLPSSSNGDGGKKKRKKDRDRR